MLVCYRLCAAMKLAACSFQIRDKSAGAAFKPGCDRGPKQGCASIQPAEQQLMSSPCHSAVRHVKVSQAQSDLRHMRHSFKCLVQLRTALPSEGVELPQVTYVLVCPSRGPMPDVVHPEWHLGMVCWLRACHGS